MEKWTLPPKIVHMNTVKIRAIRNLRKEIKETSMKYRKLISSLKILTIITKRLNF